MLVDQRKEKLLTLLKQTGQIVAKDVSRELGLSEDTIRRNLRELAREGKLKRVHGGAVPLSPAIEPFEQRTAIQNDEKAMIGACAARMIKQDQVVFLDGGTTALEVANRIASGLRATIVTHSPNIALTLMQHPAITIELIGGRLFRHSIVATGAGALGQIEGIRPDLAFIGATGIHPEHGISTGDKEEAEIKSAVISRSSASYILASAEKVGAVSSFRIVTCTDVDGLIATSSGSKAIYASLRELGCETIMADTQ